MNIVEARKLKLLGRRDKQAHVRPVSQLEMVRREHEQLAEADRAEQLEADERRRFLEATKVRVAVSQSELHDPKRDATTAPLPALSEAMLKSLERARRAGLTLSPLGAKLLGLP